MYFTSVQGGVMPNAICKANYDWIIGTDSRFETYSGLTGVTKFGIAITNEGYSTVHGPTADISFVAQKLKDLKQISVVTKTDLIGEHYYDYNNILNTQFYKINNKFIYTKHPQWNLSAKKVDYTIPCNK
jgi:hypothetical protein